MTNAVVTQAILRMGDGEDPEVFTDIAEVTSSVDDPESPPVWHTVTSHSSPTEFNEEIPGRRPAIDWAFTVNYTSHASHLALKAAKNARTVEHFQIEDTEGEGADFNAYVSFVKIMRPVDAPKTAEISLRINGEILDIPSEVSA
ncbi:MAG: hypothetical protein GEU73_04935 [Chloroflexi bacterium]|nr:hypothetical protein [Chloroflexota bacterium]